jgi:hypothetical protein
MLPQLQATKLVLSTTGQGSLLQHGMHQLHLKVDKTQHNHSTSMCCTAGTQCTTKSIQHSEVSTEGVAKVASNQTTSLKYMTRKLVTTWNASTPLRSGANTTQPLNFNVLHSWNTMNNKINPT